MSSDNINNNDNNNNNINIWTSADIDRVKEVLNTGISPDIQDQNGYTPLAAAVSYNHIELVEFLLAHGANVNLCDNEGDSPLFLAETVEMVQTLLDHGADPSITNIEGKTLKLFLKKDG
ncbi:7692_t:CDS:2 [Diversispora eburnea]|uniref:7692_t:CDS:1 n=1 Tax=Diversispora eburnea TaxID=1213867 RepID=A0A9N8VV31_9GLOM|nr:7692_t:CDS:2 [Diversispora eburnea]